MQGPRILIVDDEASLRSALFRAFDRKGFQVLTASSVREAETISQSDNLISIALVDLRLPDGDGLQLMEKLKETHKGCQVIIFTGFGSIETAVQATQRGAFHFVTKPFNLEEILSLVEKALVQRQLETQNRQLKSALHNKYRFDSIIGKSEEINRVLDLVGRVADSDSNVLVTGESGTGKELIAKAIHYNSDRSMKAFVPINCGAIPKDLLESELFGHVKGAFTGAVANRPGRFEAAEGGTIFLDEIGDMDVSLQVKLLRVLQERKFEPVGSTKSVSTNIRIIAATNIDLEKAVEEGRFREDLYYRLNVIPITVPALRNRRTDIPLLLNHFIDKYSKDSSRGLDGISEPALEALCNYPWPGNIRELENLIERLSILKGSGSISAEDLPPKYRGQASNGQAGVRMAQITDDGLDFNSAVDAYENELILRALEKTGWNRNQAAILLKLNRTTLVEKIKKKGLKPPEANA
ncbi:MAG: sigma-54-dependent Fis family transcriptional regulator [Bdellovibrionales bacterium]|nr:sigma-54-dependent Fis family transcriptional regulator [Bdellovibrionales bacterium]